MKKTRVLIAAGGTGGHVFPALAIADELRNNGHDVIWLGSGGIEMDVAPAHGFPLEIVPFSPPKGFVGALRLTMACWRAQFVIRRIRPDVILGMGGYAATPGCFAAKSFGIPVVIHEQNAVGGRANQVLTQLAKHTLGGFPDAFSDLQWVGNPVRKKFLTGAAPANRVCNCHTRRLLILGGSQGAELLNSIVPAALEQTNDSFDVFHQCGRGNIERTKSAYNNAKKQAKIIEFIDDVAEQMMVADLIICRAGAATLAEIAAVGAPALLVPYPYATDDHQSHNARFFDERDAAFVCSSGEFKSAWLADFLTAMTREQLLLKANNAKALARPKAAELVAQICIDEAEVRKSMLLKVK